MISPEFPAEVPTRVPERTLRQFGAICLAVFGTLFALAWYRNGREPGASGWLVLALAASIGLAGLFIPNTIRPLYLAIIAMTRPIGHIVGLVLLAVVYYGVLTPIAIAFRLARRDGLGRFRSSSTSYWVERIPTNDVRAYLRQYQRQTLPGQNSRIPATIPSPPPAAARPPMITELSQPRPTSFTGVRHESA